MPFLNFTVCYIKNLIKQDNIKFDNLENHLPYTNGKAHHRTSKLEIIVK